MSNYPTKNILVPVDFSENSWNALSYAVALYKKIRCNFYILHVANLKDQHIDAARLFPTPADFGNQTVFDKKKLLDVFLDKTGHHFDNENHDFSGHMEYGNLLDAVRRQMSEKQIDLIVMGTTGIHNLKKKVMGSNTGAIITRVRCNSLIVPEKAQYKPLRSIAFPTDFNIFYTPKVLKSLSEVLNLNTSNLHVVHVSNSQVGFTDGQKANKDYLFDYLDEVFPTNHDFAIIRDKKIVHAIQDFVSENNIGMISMIARNLNFLQQLFFDSKVKIMSFHTSVPMMVIHE
ncbi:universal stress protein [Flagellimonas pacifica]|uniref:Nucleotide-binding universal stress protein, UspA family n=1 Tax=Flagellimonas pacifica TaxID=1247520 RepID=A0A285MVP0_9FLAO|nr:universal stress protein [Allomuricauda parva]SNZ00743.1 Nucleotide-binding universal stress protein, UspA family [Allomuricauda parva]